MRKTCSKCKNEQDLNDFYGDRSMPDGKHSHCKICVNKHKVFKYKNNPEFRKKQLLSTRKRADKVRKILTIKTLIFKKKAGCIDCGEKDPRVLDFDHLSDKNIGISDMVSKQIIWEEIEKEISKCVVRCANCHRRKTAVQLMWFKGINFDDLESNLV